MYLDLFLRAKNTQSQCRPALVHDRHGIHMRTAIGVCVLVLQLGSIFYARFTPHRYFCWAPNDYVVEYQLDVTLHGVPLTTEEVWARYRIDPGHQQRVEYPAEHLIGMLEQYERSYGKSEGAEVRLTWKYNGHPELKEWRWPQ